MNPGLTLSITDNGNPVPSQLNRLGVHENHLFAAPATESLQAAPPSRLTSAASATPPARRRPRKAAHAGPGKMWSSPISPIKIGKMWSSSPKMLEKCGGFTLGLSINDGDLKNIQPMNGILMWSSPTKMGKMGVLWG